MYEFNVIPWCPTAPSKPGLYIVMTREGTLLVASVFPEKGNLFVNFEGSCLNPTAIEKTEACIMQWSPRIAWTEIFV